MNAFYSYHNKQIENEKKITEILLRFQQRGIFY